MLSITDLRVFYGESRVLNDISLEVPAGQIVCLMGRNGMGKTTLLKTIMGLLKARQGKIVFNDKDITKLSPHLRARSSIGYVPQGRGIFPYLTIYENLLMGLEASPQRQHMADEIVEEIYGIFPVLKTMNKRMAGTLSGGQQQQLALGRALMSRPQMLLLDEPTEGIQPNIVQEIEHLIGRLRDERGIAVLLVEQFLDFAMGVANHCYVIEKGKIVASGAPSELDQNVVREHLSV
jgi:urea transport system ATP-binding protein